MQTAIPETFNADIAIVIPCFNEPTLNETLSDLVQKDSTGKKVLVIIVVNSGIKTDPYIIEQNRKTYFEVQKFASQYSSETMMFFPVIVENLPRKHAGVGLARKIGMDLSIDCFLKIQNPRGIIISLDADCLVSENYIPSIYQAFQEDSKLSTVILNYHHRVENDDPKLENAIRQYENYIQYFENALRYIGFPYYYHTIGSAFAVSADAYVQVGGMGRQQGGEDFYFLQKVFQMGRVKELADTYVYPKARYSDRIPFGTGPALQKIIDESNAEMMVYSTDSFEALKSLFSLKDTFFKQEESQIKSSISRLHPAVVHFLNNNNFIEEINDCNSNSATIPTFQKRFFHHFNAFKIIKYLNFAHPSYFELQPLNEALTQLANTIR